MDSVFSIANFRTVTSWAEDVSYGPRPRKVSGERKWYNVFCSCIKRAEWSILHLILKSSLHDVLENVVLLDHSLFD